MSVSEWKASGTTQNVSAGVLSVSEWKQSQPAPEPGFFQKAGDFLFGNPIAKAVASAITTPPAPKNFDQQEALRLGFQTISDTVTDTADRFNKLSEAWTTPTTPLQKAVATGRAGMGVINNIFLGITAPLNALRGQPGVGYIADGISNLFGAFGAGGGQAMSLAVDALPVSDKAKEEIRPLAEEIGALTAQIVAGKGGADAVSIIGRKSKAILDTVHSELQVARTTIEGQLPKDIKLTDTGVETPISFANKYETPGIIQMGVKPKDTLPVIQTVAGWKESGMPSVAPESARTAPITPKVEIAPETATKPRTTQTLKSIPGTGEIKTRGVAESIEATAIEKGIVDTLGDLPQYKGVNFKEQATMVTDLITKDPEGARQIALGEKPAPTGVIPEMVAVGVEKQAVKTGDVQTLLDLANSKLTVAGTTMGQRIAAYGQRDLASPLDAIRDVQQARAETIKIRGVDTVKESAKEIASIKQEVVNVVSKSRPKWETFIKEITCGY